MLQLFHVLEGHGQAGEDSERLLESFRQLESDHVFLLRQLLADVEIDGHACVAVSSGLLDEGEEGGVVVF